MLFVFVKASNAKPDFAAADRSPLLLSEGGTVNGDSLVLTDAAIAHHIVPERRINWWQLAALAYVTVAGAWSLGVV